MRSLVFALAALLPSLALAQSGGGYSAGPGLAPPEQREVPAPAPAANAPAANAPAANAPADAQGADQAAAEAAAGKGEFRTNVTSFKPSPTYTQVREFTTARLWVLDPGQVTVEQWFNGSFGSHDASATNTGDLFFQTEVELGIYKHMQLDIYFNYQFNQNDSGGYQWEKGGHTGVAAELRYAIGDYWGQIWGNPTLYFELTSQYYNSPRAELRLLMGGSLFGIDRLLGAINLGFERNIFRDQDSLIDYELKADLGLNYAIVPDVVRIGVEGVLGWDSHGTPGTLSVPGSFNIGNQGLFPVVEVGPSVILMEPHKRLKLLAAFLFALSDYDSPYLPTIIASTTF